MSASIFTQTLPKILCCICGTVIDSNPSNMCVECVKTRVDISEGISKQLVINFCKGCGRYLQPPATWLFCDPESPQLLSFCLKRIKGMNRVKLIDASFVWTEPHSKRLKVKLTVQKEVFNSAIIQQSFIIEYVVTDQQCDKCTKLQTNQNFWTAAAQVRQKTGHKRTFYFLEQLILKHSAHANTLSIKEFPDGVDFYFGHRSHTLKFVDFLNAVVPIRYKTSERLISQDDKSNTFTYNYTFSVEIAPVCKDDLVCLPPKLAQSMGNISPLVLCTKVSSILHFIDPFTLKGCDLIASTYWKYNFTSLMNSRQLIEYVVLDVVPRGPPVGKLQLADVQCAKSSDFGSNDTTHYTVTHLGNILKPGDLCLGYDYSSANFNEDDVKSLRRYNYPDVVLVRKAYPEKKKKARVFKLKTLDKDKADVKKSELEKEEEDYEQFLDDLEHDRELRAQINLYKAPNASAPSRADKMADDDEDEQGDDDIQLEELLEEMNINDDEGGDA